MGGSHATQILSSAPELAGPMLSVVMDRFPALKNLDVEKIQQITGLEITDFIELMSSIPETLATGQYSKIQRILADHPNVFSNIVRWIAKGKISENVLDKFNQSAINNKVNNVSRLLQGNLDPSKLEEELAPQKPISLITEYPANKN
jgi:hypothetical protein